MTSHCYVAFADTHKNAKELAAGIILPNFKDDLATKTWPQDLTRLRQRLQEAYHCSVVAKVSRKLLDMRIFASCTTLNAL